MMQRSGVLEHSRVMSPGRLIALRTVKPDDVLSGFSASSSGDALFLKSFSNFMREENPDRLVRVRFVSGDTVICTPAARIQTAKNGAVYAKYIKPGMRVMTTSFFGKGLVSLPENGDILSAQPFDSTGMLPLAPSATRTDRPQDDLLVARIVSMSMDAFGTLNQKTYNHCRNTLLTSNPHIYGCPVWNESTTQKIRSRIIGPYVNWVMEVEGLDHPPGNGGIMTWKNPSSLAVAIGGSEERPHTIFVQC